MLSAWKRRSWPPAPVRPAISPYQAATGRRSILIAFSPRCAGCGLQVLKHGVAPRAGEQPGAGDRGTDAGREKGAQLAGPVRHDESAAEGALQQTSSVERSPGVGHRHDSCERNPGLAGGASGAGRFPPGAPHDHLREEDATEPRMRILESGGSGSAALPSPARGRPGGTSRVLADVTECRSPFTGSRSQRRVYASLDRWTIHGSLLNRLHGLRRERKWYESGMSMVLTRHSCPRVLRRAPP
jgi:hypothetical protein